MKKILFELLVEFYQTSYTLFYKNPKTEATKLGYAILKVRKANQKFIDEYNDEKDAVMIKLCITDKDTKEIIYEISRDPKGNEIRNYKFTPDNKIKMVKEIRLLEQIWNEKEIEIKTFVVQDVPELTEYEEEIFEGIVI